LKVISELDPK
jgi:hypothetical protein